MVLVCEDLHWADASTLDLISALLAADRVDDALERVRALQLNLGEDEVARLASQGINCLRMVSGMGAVCWSARTLHPTDRPMPELAV